MHNPTNQKAQHQKQKEKEKMQQVLNRFKKDKYYL